MNAFTPWTVWFTIKSMVGALCLGVGLALVWGAITGHLGRIPVLERLVGQGVRPRVRRKRFLTRVEQDTLVSILKISSTMSCRTGDRARLSPWSSSTMRATGAGATTRATS